MIERPKMIEFDKVVVRFAAHTVLDGVSFRLPAGKVSYIIGASGGGKSTILRVIMGFVKPASGKVTIDKADVTGLSEKRYSRIRKKMGMVFQGSALFDSMTVAENVAFYPVYREREKPASVAARVSEILSALGLEGTEKLYPAELSGGMRRRVALARALIYQPKILLYDEPTTGLDPLTIELVDEIIRETNDKFGITSVVVSHDMASVFETADHIVFMDAGKSFEIGGRENLLGSELPGVAEFTRSFRATADRVSGAAREVS